jgi:hypothetical protein
MLQSPNAFLIKTMDVKHNKNIDFQIKMDYDKKTNKTNFKIDSKLAGN